MTNELLQKAKECKSAEELLALAKENNVEMTAEEAAAKFAALNNAGELSDDELENAAGGGCTVEVVGRRAIPKPGQVFTVTHLPTAEHFECRACKEIYFRCTSVTEKYVHCVCTKCGDGYSYPTTLPNIHRYKVVLV